ncbi:PREDICTED: uncharacterized protein LOC109114807 [Nelumbo nucifera]|uniref:Uncharacterized protein LOC109114807 n=1 Tax=Nelumbo nucifera TaxID=4432 RepID=A0A1U8Q4L3_NELNU|nr:PREDICTED: uncharacterized protein LOC109114807 [Nelumbo nucifera]
MDAAKPISSPMVVHPKLTRHDGSPLADPTEYRSIVGTLQYVAITHPDISFVVSKVSQFLQAPTDDHWAAMKRILRYLKHTIMHGLNLSWTSSTSLTLHAFFDADWAGYPDDRRSIEGFAIYLGPNLILGAPTNKQQLHVPTLSLNFVLVPHPPLTFSPSLSPVITSAS